MSILDKASLIQIPSGYKSTKLYSLRPSNGDGDFTFARSSSATRVNSEGLIEEVPYNLLEQSNDFDTTWTLSASIDLTSGQSGYDGSNDAWLLKRNSTGSRYVQQTLTRPSGQYSFSVYLKAESTDWSYIWAYDGSTGVDAYFDLNNGVVGNTSGLDSTNVVSVGDDWYRCTITFTQAITSVRIYPAYANGSVATGTDNGIYIQDAQVNKGSTAKTYFPTTDRLNVPRLDYSGGASCASLLLEPQRTNLVTYSNDFTTGWSNLTSGSGVNPVVTSNQGISPDGSLNADKVVFDLNGGTSSSDFSLLNYNLSGFSNPHTLDTSIYLKSSDGNNYQVAIYNRGVSAQIITVTNQWQRFSANGTRSNTTNNFRIGLFGDSTSNTASLLIFGAQAELGSYPTSYIPTSGSTVTRTADVCNNAGTSATFNDSEGVLFFEGSLLDISENDKRISISDGLSVENRITLRFLDDNELSVQIGFTNGFDETFTLSEINNKIAVVYDSTNASVFINGVKLVTNTMSSLSGLSQLQFNRFGGISNDFYGKCKQLMVFNEALSDEEISDLTGQVNLSFNNLATFYGYTIL